MSPAPLRRVTHRRIACTRTHHVTHWMNNKRSSHFISAGTSRGSSPLSSTLRAPWCPYSHDRSRRIVCGSQGSGTTESALMMRRVIELQLVLTSSYRTTPPAGLAMMTALERYEVPRQKVDSVGELRARTMLLRTSWRYEARLQIAGCKH